MITIKVTNVRQKREDASRVAKVYENGALVTIPSYFRCYIRPGSVRYMTWEEE